MSGSSPSTRVATRRRVVAFVVALFTGILLLGPAPIASAHATLVSSTPADGSVLAQSPPTAELRFSEEILATASAVQLVRIGTNTMEPLQFGVADGGATMIVTLPHLEVGAYLLRAVAVDPADLHWSVATVAFGIGVPAPVSSAGSATDSSWTFVALRTVSDAGLLVAVGAALLVLLLTWRGLAVTDGLRRAALMGSSVVLLGWLGQLLVDADAIDAHVDWGSLLVRSDPGRRLLLGALLVAALGAVTWWSRHRAAAQGTLTRAGVVVACGLVVTAALGGHSSIGGAVLVGTALRALHLAALGAWLGLVAVAWWWARRGGGRVVPWPTVSRIATTGLALTGVTGLLLSGRVVATVTALLDSSFGRLLIAKAVGLGVLAILGIGAARRVARGGAPRLVAVEILVGIVALGLAGGVVGSSPAVGERYEPLPSATPQIVTGDAADLTVSATLRPARPGPNLLQVRVIDTRKPAPGPIESVTVRVAAADGTIVAERSGVPQKSSPLEWQDLQLPSPGDYRVEVRADRPAAPAPAFVDTWHVERPPVPRASTVITNAAWAPIAGVGAALWIVIVMVGRWLITRRRRGDRFPEPDPADVAELEATAPSPPPARVTTTIARHPHNGVARRLTTASSAADAGDTMTRRTNIRRCR